MDEIHTPINPFPWRLVEMWPADGKWKRLHRWHMIAVHFPKTTMNHETIEIKKGRYHYRRVKINNRWTNPRII